MVEKLKVMLQDTEIRDRITIRDNVGGSRQVLLKSSHLKIVRTPTQIEMDCFGDKLTSKRDICAIATFFRKYCELTGNIKLLVSLPRVWGLDLSAWDFISKPGVFGHYSVAFISTELYQTLLLRELERSNHSVKIFKTKEHAQEWLEMQGVNHGSFI